VVEDCPFPVVLVKVLNVVEELVTIDPELTTGMVLEELEVATLEVVAEVVEVDDQRETEAEAEAELLGVQPHG
jgi:hypothetical protein